MKGVRNLLAVLCCAAALLCARPPMHPIETAPATRATEAPETVPPETSLSAGELVAQRLGQRSKEVSPFGRQAQGILDAFEEREISELYTDEDKIKDILKLLFDVKRDQICEDAYADFDFSVFWASEKANAANLDYFCKDILAEKGMNTVSDLKQVNGQTKLTYAEIAIHGKEAQVQVNEEFTWVYYTDAEPGAYPYYSGAWLDYSITLVKQGDGWYISDIVFDKDNTRALRENELRVEDWLVQWFEANN